MVLVGEPCLHPIVLNQVLHHLQVAFGRCLDQRSGLGLLKLSIDEILLNLVRTVPTFLQLLHHKHQHFGVLDGIVEHLWSHFGAFALEVLGHLQVPP